MRARVVLSDYQRAKTGALFAAATAAGAATAGHDPAAWRALGEWLGEAYQVADDIRDVSARASELGKPTGATPRSAARARCTSSASAGALHACAT